MAGNRHLLSWKGQHFAFSLDKGLLSLHTVFPSKNRKTIPLNWKLRVPPKFFGLLMPLNQQENKFVTVLDGMIDLHYQRQIELLVCNFINVSGIQKD